MSTVNLTVAQAVVKFLGAQYSESDGVEQKLFAGCFGSFGHGTVAGLVKATKAVDDPIVIYVETDPLIGAPDSESWWDVPVSATLRLKSTQRAQKGYDEHKATQKLFL